MTPAGIGLVAASILLDLPSALARLFLTAVIAGLAGLLDWRGDLIVLLVAFGPYLRSVGALVVPLPAGPFLRQAAGARKPSERERAALQHAFSLLPDGVAPGSVLVVDGPDENAWVLGCTLFVERGLFDSPHLAAVMAHEAGHLAAGDGRVALAAWWLPVRSAAWVAARLMGSRHRSLPQAGTALPQPQAAGSGAGILPDPRFRILGGLLRLPGIAAGVVALLFAGGLFPMLLRQVWSAYRRSREFAADAFAASAGHGPALVEALGTWQMLDVATPWWLRLSHPYVEQRIDRLQRLPVE
ncbi:MAG TPA: M48 family metalloprotease [Actinomycetota bacterium]|nr:M48 family metalloprotease [Actinomycetota bacterium]